VLYILHHVYQFNLIFLPVHTLEPGYTAFQLSGKRRWGDGVYERLIVFIFSVPSLGVHSLSLSIADSCHMEGGMPSLSRGRQPSSQRNRQLGQE